MRRASPGRNVPAKAFTLTELMIAIGILGVGLTMAAALFPAGLKNSQRSAQNVIGTIVAENGLNIAKMRLAHNISAGLTHQVVDVTSQLGPLDLQYPINTGPWGSIVLARRCEPDPNSPQRQTNDYEIYVISYRAPTGHRVEAVQIQAVDIADGTSTTSGIVRLSNAGDYNTKVKQGTPVICAWNGRYGSVAAVLPPNTGSVAQAQAILRVNDSLDRASAGITPYVLWVVAERQGPNPGDPFVQGGQSPAAEIFVTRTSLNPPP